MTILSLVFNFFFAGRYEILRFLLFVVKAGNVAVLCQKTPTHPMCSCSLLLYISTHTHSQREGERRREKDISIYCTLNLYSAEGWVCRHSGRWHCWRTQQIADIDTVKAENNESVIKEATLWMYWIQSLKINKNGAPWNHESPWPHAWNKN